MDYRILGKLEVWRDGEEVDLGAFRQRAMLAMLLTSPNTVLSTDQLIDGLWGDDGSVERQNSLWVYVSGLRKALDPEREKRSDGSIVLTRAPGYLIEAEPDEIDSLRFERMIGEARSLADTDPAAASLVYGEALALWRGKALEEFTYEYSPSPRLLGSTVCASKRSKDESTLTSIEACHVSSCPSSKRWSASIHSKNGWSVS